ncbi:hypothetical protein [Rhodanobacter sp. C05]|uniref:hypothetical protein n=1 Tax=Rhodanobacter sp. C05 TaxID=1945855 RepID=UPI001179F7AF|nr:hypothetical protein [Rhodanobacter sp. C05]
MTRPFVIWVTVVISALLAVAAVFGLLKVILQLPLWLAPDSGMAVWRIVFIVAVQTVETVFLIAVSYAAFTRPRWGRVICAVFASLITLAMLYAGLHPDPHPLFAIKPGPEEAGAVIGRLATCMLFCAYAYKMVIGAKVRVYFQSNLRNLRDGGN